MNPRNQWSLFYSNSKKKKKKKKKKKNLFNNLILINILCYSLYNELFGILILFLFIDLK